MSRRRLAAGALGVALLLGGASPLRAQSPLPLDPVRPRGLPVSPVYEGWYRNPDGSYTLSFGYINRNSEEVLEVPVGPANHVEPAGIAQTPPPTHFLPRRHYGVYTVTLPADFPADRPVVWTLDYRGKKYSIPANRSPLYVIDAMGSPASGEKPPALRLAEGGPAAEGPAGTPVGPVRATAGAPLPLTAWTAVHGDHPVTVRWYKYSGPGSVTFATQEAEVDRAAGKVATTATFSEPGEYVLYVRANVGKPGAGPLVAAGQEQCCWTNAYLKVTVTR